MNNAAGWYGKIASLGDFASRRLPDEFIARWDAWLQQVIAASRSRLGDAWLESYLTSPVWRFVEWPLVDGAPLHVGVLMPSVDKVGRYFPLCLAAALPVPPTLEADWRALDDWLARVEAVALATLDTRRSAQQFDDALLALPLSLPQRPGGTTAASLLDQLCGAIGPTTYRLEASESIASLFSDLAAQSLRRGAAGASLWWCGGGLTVACRGLPDAERFAAMLRTEAPGAV